MIFNKLFKQNKPIKTRTLYPYEKEYRSLIGKTLTIDKLNDFTDKLFHKYMYTFGWDIIRNSNKFEATFDFNELTPNQIIEECIEQELTPDNNVLMFDVIDYEPSDYHLTLDIELLKNGKIKIVDVSVNS